MKRLQISMGWWNVEDSSEDFNESVTDYDAVRHYCINDVESTFEFTKRSLKAIRERQTIRANEGLDCLNYSDSKLGEQLILKEYCELNMTSLDMLKNDVRHVDVIKLSDIIFPWIEFETEQFQNILIDLKTKEIRDGENIGFDFLFDNMKVTVAEGGIHGSKSGLFCEDDEWMIVDGDVSSEYPACIVENNIEPVHLPGLSQIVRRYYQARLQLKERVNDKRLSKDELDLLQYRIGRLKLSINSVFG